jgi:hypothetical protein
MQLSDAHRWSSGSRALRDQVSGADSGGVPPVPIPNTAVKTASADGSRTAGSLESRSVPDHNEMSPPAAMPAGSLILGRRRQLPEELLRRGGLIELAAEAI